MILLCNGDCHFETHITITDTDDIVRWCNSDAVRLNMQEQRMQNAEHHQNYTHT